MSVGSHGDGQAGAEQVATTSAVMLEEPPSVQAMAAPSKALVDELMKARRERYRQVRLTMGSRSCQVFPLRANGGAVNGKADHHASTAPAMLGAASTTLAVEEEGNDKLQGQSTAHLLLRILVLSYIVPLCDAGDDGLPDKLTTHGFTCQDAVNFMRGLLQEQSGAMEHRFKSKPEESGATSSNAFESTTFELWAVPRLLTASAVLCLRSSGHLPGLGDDKLSLLSTSLVELSVSLMKMSLLMPHQGGVIRCLLTENFRAALRAAATSGRASFMPSLPPPTALVPRAGDEKSLISFFTDDSCTLKQRSKAYGDGINRLWMKEDHTAFEPELHLDNPLLQSTFARIVLLLSCQTCMSVALSGRAELNDLQDTANMLLLSSWQWDTILDDRMLCGRALPPPIQSRRLEVASSSLTSRSMTPYIDRLRLLAGDGGELAEQEDCASAKDSTPIDFATFLRLKKVNERYKPDTSTALQKQDEEAVRICGRLCCASTNSLLVVKGAILCKVCDVPRAYLDREKDQHCSFDGMPSLQTSVQVALMMFSAEKADVKRKFAALHLVCRQTNHSLPQQVRLLVPRQHLSKLLRLGLTDANRRVRIQAGKLTASVVAGLCHSLLASHQSLRSTLEPLFAIYRDILDTGKAGSRETALLGLASLGYHDRYEVQALALPLIIMQIGGDSLQKSLAYTIVTELAGHYRLTVYQLLSPFLEIISVQVIEQIHSTPTLFLELLQITNQNQAKFLRSTLQYTLPHVLEAGNEKTLSLIARGIGQDIQTLCFNSTPDILKYFLMQPPLRRDRGINRFIETVRGGGAHDINLRSLLKSYSVEMLGHLVTRLGDPDLKKAALAGLHHMNSVLNDRQGMNKSTSSKDMSLAAFLKDEILAILSWINDEMMNGHGKKTVIHKVMVAESIGALIDVVGQSIAVVTPQLMATMNTTMQIRELILPTLHSWHTFITKLGYSVVGPFIGQTAASLVASWPRFGVEEKQMAVKILSYIVVDSMAELRPFLLQDFPNLEELRGDIPEICNRLASIGSSAAKRPEHRLQHILDRAANENVSVCGQALIELKTFLHRERAYVERITTGNTFDPVVSKIVHILFATLARDDETETLRDICLDNLGSLGAIDPDRFKHDAVDQTHELLQSFNDKDEIGDFAVHLIKDLLVSAFKATNDTKHQAALAYAIQELLKLAGFSAALLPQNSAYSKGATVSLRVRQRWHRLPPEILDTVAPLLESKYSVHLGDMTHRERPIYLHSQSYKDWLQHWTNDLIVGASGDAAKAMFGIFRSVIRDHDLSIAQYILPHLVLNVLVLGSDEQRQQVREEVVAVLEDQVTPTTTFEPERRLLSAQIIFTLFDHMSVWIRTRAQHRSKQSRRLQGESDAAVARVESLVGNISQELMAVASLKCRAYARSLLNFEERIRTLKNQGKQNAEIQEHYANMHLIYANLDEPDGMEGISTCVISPSLEHQIREHESTGRWTSAQSCWEVKIQENPDDLQLHLGLLRCLRNLGHYDTMRTHIRGVLAVHPQWEKKVDSFYLEGCCILSDWDEVQRRLLIHDSIGQTSPAHATARVLLAMHQGDQGSVGRAIREARSLLGKPLIAAGKSSYVSVYDSVTQLHMLHELGMISEVMNGAASSTSDSLADLSKALSVRLDSTLPSFRTREPLLSVRRSAFSTRKMEDFRTEIGQSWIASSKIARRSGHLQTAYSAALQASQWRAPLAFVQQAKLLAINDQGQAALQEMQHAFAELQTPPREGTEERLAHSFANARLLRARLADQAGRSKPNEIVEQYKNCTELDPKSEKMWYYLGHYYDQISEGDSVNNIMVANVFTQHLNTIRYLLRSATFGTKFFYRSLPRVLTLWFDCGNNEETISSKTSSKVSSKATTGASAESKTQTFRVMNENVARTITKIAPYQWLAVFPQLVSRMVHKNELVWKVLQEIICHVAHHYPHQAMWTMIAGSQSKDPDRKRRFYDVITKLKGAPSPSKSTAKASISRVVDQTLKMAKELLYLCDFPVPPKEAQLSLPAQFPRLLALAEGGDLILPLQSSISVTMPGNYKTDSEHRAFPKELPRIIGFDPKVEVMSSLQRPRKLIIHASDGKHYPFLCKPKDDLRKDARLMEFDTMINNLLQSNPESRKRQLYIRTYSVVTLNEECGLIEWVPNTIGLRHILARFYRTRDIQLYSADVQKDMDKARADSRNAGEIFDKLVLSKYPPVFHEWFRACFPEPSAWLRARLAYAHTLAVMSMVGYVLGLGDRHGENILFDSESGDTVHVDLNCLFDKGSTFEIPERVPFRLTQNMVDALGVTGYEGVFRRAAEISMGILRDNKDSLMSVLEAMLHDPLVEWAVDEKGKSRMPSRPDPRMPDPRLEQAKKALNPVREKLNGKLKKVNAESGMPSRDAAWTSAYSTNSLVDALIRDATSKTLLAQMYVGWGSYL